MENKIKLTKPADARIVQAVRKLKSSKVVDQTVEIGKNQDEKDIQNSIKIEETKPKKTLKKTLTPINQLNFIDKKKNSTNNNLINVSSSSNNNILNGSNKNHISKNDISKSNSNNKITIDADLQKPNTGSTNKTAKTFDYETLKRYKKRKQSDYQKNLLSKESIEKYKSECVNLIKKENELKNLLAQMGIVKDEDYLLYITNTFFNKPHFLFSLEILIMETVEESNKLKVFRNVKKVLPLKVVKENFYRDEIKKDLNLKIYEGEYNNKFNNFMQSLDNFINNLKNGDL
jgi:hypothetical protein